jgi:oligoendopeptidase F
MESYRSLFPITENASFLNHAAVSPLSLRAVAAVQAFLEESSRKGIVCYPRWMKWVDAVRTLFGRLMNAEAEEIADHWWREKRRLFGARVEMIAPYRWGWACIPHFVHQPFCCYSYIFGYLLAVRVLEAHEREGKAFLDRAIGFMEAGSSEAPLERIARLGWDARDKGFWEAAFGPIEGWITELEAQVRG